MQGLEKEKERHQDCRKAEGGQKRGLGKNLQGMKARACGGKRKKGGDKRKKRNAGHLQHQYGLNDGAGQEGVRSGSKREVAEQKNFLKDFLVLSAL